MAGVMLAVTGLGLQAQAPCSGATALTCGGIANGNTVGGFPVPSGNAWLTAPSRWFSFVGNGQVVRIQTSASYDAKVTVGWPAPGGTSCWPANLVGTNDNGRGLGNVSTNRDAEIAWFAVQGVQYYIVVHGANGQTGSFQLNFNCDGTNPPNNDACANAKRLFDCVTDINLTTHNATNENFLHPEDGLTSSGRGVWFRARDLVGEHVLTTCGESRFDTRLFVWQVAAGAGCASITTTAPNFYNDDQCGSSAEVTFQAVSGKDYLILLDGWNTNRGTYSLDLCFPASKNGVYAPPVEALTVSPNPANTQVRFDFAVQHGGVVQISLFNLAGQQVASVRSGELKAGMSASSDLDVSSLPSGMYLYRAEIDGKVQSGKVQVAH